MKKEFKATFITKEKKKLKFSFDISINKDETSFEMVDDLKKEDFLNHYLDCINRSVNPFVINPKIPNELKRSIYQTATYNLNNKERGHVLCSSGTTSLNSRPKTYYFPIARPIENAIAHCESLDIQNNKNIIFPLPLSHSFGVVIGIWASLTSNSKTYILDEGSNLNDILDLLSEIDAHLLYLNPSLVRQINKFAKRFKKKLNCPEKISIGSSILYYEDVIKIKEVFPSSEIYYTYGLTEMGPRVATFKIDDCKAHKGLIPIGKMLEGIQYKINENQLFIQSPYACIDFENQLYATSDEVQIIDHNIFIKGRIDDTIIYQGINIYPSEIELIIKEELPVDEVVLIAKDSKLHGEVPVLIVKSEISEEDIYSFLKRKIPETHMPKEIHYRNDFPKTSMGKINRKKLKSSLE